MALGAVNLVYLIQMKNRYIIYNQKHDYSAERTAIQDNALPYLRDFQGKNIP